MASSVMSQLTGLLSAPDPLDPEDARRMRFALHDLLGTSSSAVKESASEWWRHQTAIGTTTGSWSVYALEMEIHAAGDVDVYKRCLLVRYDDRRRLAAAAVVGQLNDTTGLGSGITWSEPMIVVGRGDLGSGILKRP